MTASLPGAAAEETQLKALATPTIDTFLALALPGVPYERNTGDYIYPVAGRLGRYCKSVDLGQGRIAFELSSPSKWSVRYSCIIEYHDELHHSLRPLAAAVAKLSTLHELDSGVVTGLGASRSNRCLNPIYRMPVGKNPAEVYVSYLGDSLPNDIAQMYERVCGIMQEYVALRSI